MGKSRSAAGEYRSARAASLRTAEDIPQSAEHSPCCLPEQLVKVAGSGAQIPLKWRVSETVTWFSLLWNQAIRVV